MASSILQKNEQNALSAFDIYWPVTGISLKIPMRPPRIRKLYEDTWEKVGNLILRLRLPYKATYLVL